MKRELISNVAAVSVLFVVIVMFSRSGSTQSSISDCKQPFGNPPCNANNNAKFNDGQNTGCKVDFHWLRCDGVTHGSVYDSCTNLGCKESCSCSCGTNGYGVSWYNTCTDVVKSESFSCNRCSATPSPEPAPTPCSPTLEFDGGTMDSCECNPDDPNCVSPVLIDISGNGFNLTDAAGGVDFDIRAAGATERVSWTTPFSDDAWLVLDRNGNGAIDDGSELFGNFTPQPTPSVGQERNGFLALAQYDKPVTGGNEDGLITPSDAIFASLRVWQDLNHNGMSEVGELRSLQSVALRAIELDYKVAKKRDEHGNYFRYRAKVRGGQDGHLGRWAWDVFLVTP
jgi:hypothetical protein